MTLRRLTVTPLGALRALLLGGALLPPMLGTAVFADGRETGRQPLDSITTLASDFLRAHHAGDPTLKLDGGKLDPRLRLGRCADEPVAMLAPGSGDTGRVTVRVSCPTLPAWRVHVQLEVTRERRVWTLAREVARGEPLRRELLVQRTVAFGRETSRLLGSAVPIESPGQWLGYELVRDARAGQVLSAAMLAAPRLVRRDGQVRIRRAGRGLAVETTGIALADAALGERVTVRNRVSGRTLDATVVGRDAVEIGYARQ